MASTNILAQAREQLDAVLAMTNSARHAEAQLKRGWTFWEGNALARSDARLTNALAAFMAAANGASNTANGIMALHKAGDTLFLLGRFAEAATNYSRVVAMLDAVPGIKTKVGPEALHQLTRTQLQLGNFPAAGEASEQLLHLFPSDPLASQARLLYVQALLDRGQTSEARTTVTNLLARVPAESALPEAQIVLARTYARQNQWTNAIAEYETWLGKYTNHTLRPVIEYERAAFYYQAGKDEAAHSFYTNFIALYPTHPLAPRAQTAIADYFYNNEQWIQAEQNYQRVYQSTNWPASEIKYRAQLWAARAAFARQNYKEAAEYLKNLVVDKSCPSNQLAEAWFILGDVLLEQPTTSTNALQNYSDAITAFSKIPQEFPTDRLVPLAWGKVGDCHFQYASLSPESYSRATNAYFNVLKHTNAPVSALCQAHVGIGDVLEKLSSLETNPEARSALLRQALDHHLDVIYGEGLNGQPADPYWLTRAAASATRLAEAMGQGEQAIQLYQRLMALLPARAADYEKRIRALSRTP